MGRKDGFGAAIVDVEVLGGLNRKINTYLMDLFPSMMSYKNSFFI